MQLVSAALQKGSLNIIKVVHITCAQYLKPSEDN